MNKKILFSIIAGVVLLAGGVVGAFTFIKSPKEAYLYAEYKSLNSAIEQLEQRFEEDLKWNELTKKHPTKTDYELSADVEDWYNFLDYEIIDAINSSSIDLTVQSDPKDNSMALSIGATIFDFTIDPFTAYLKDKKVVGEMPFQDEALEINIEKLLELSEEELGNACLKDADLERLIKQKEIITAEDLEHLQKKLLPEIIKSLPDKAFKKDGNELTMNLTSGDFEKILDVTADTLKEDKVIKRIVNDYLILEGECENYTVAEAIDEIMSEISNADIDSSLKSVITVEGSHIVERKLYIEDELVLKGTQNFKDKIVFDYEITDSENDITAILKGEIGTGKDIRDEFKIAIEEMEILYESKEEQDKKEREFERTITATDGYEEILLKWDGTQSFTGDSYVSDNEILFDIREGSVSLHVKSDSKKTKGFDLPKDTINLTDMSESEMEEYFTNDIAENFLIWAEDLIYEFQDLLNNF